tara:strand:+ start:616 stop:843 length:228 start_codon:yes stop_codon:yes gene_type:complete
MKISKELKAINKALNDYYNKHEGNVVISVSVSAFDKECEVIDDQIWLMGDTEILLIDNESVRNEIKDIGLSLAVS